MTADTREQQRTYRIEKLASMFETRTRDDGSEFVALKDSAPEWASDFVREAHGTEILPDDYRYRWISEALDLLAEADDPSDPDLHGEFMDGASIYTHDLLAWLSSNLTRIAYCDQAAEDFGTKDDADLTSRIQLGQALERSEVFHNVLRELDTLDR